MKSITNTTKMIIFSSIFCLCVIAFYLLYYFQVISNLDFYAAMVYITYFAGLALYYNSKILKEKNKINSSRLCSILSIFLILISIAALIYGFSTGNLHFWIW